MMSDTTRPQTVAKDVAIASPTYTPPGETDPIPFRDIMSLMTENLGKSGSAVIQDIDIAKDPGQLRRVKIGESAPDLKAKLDGIDSTLFIGDDKRLFDNFKSLLEPSPGKEITMSDAIRNLENLCAILQKIVPSTDEIRAAKQMAEPLLRTFFNERLEHNERIVKKIRDMSFGLPSDKLGIFLWDDEGHTSTVMLCPPNYYYLDPCGCRQFGRHPVTSVNTFDHVMETRLQYDGYNCRTMAYIMAENSIATFEKIGGSESFNQHFGGPQHFGTMKEIVLADGRRLSIAGEQDPAKFAETHTPPINIPPELLTIAQRSAVFRQYQTKLSERIADLEQQQKEIEKHKKSIVGAAGQEEILSKALKTALDKTLNKSDEYKGAENKSKREQKVLEIFELLLSSNPTENVAPPFADDKTVKGLVSGIKAVRQLKSQASQIVGLQKQIDQITPQLTDFQQRLALIEVRRKEVILETTSKKEDSKAVVAKRADNLAKLVQIKAIPTSGPGPSGDSHTDMPSPTSLPSKSSQPPYPSKP